MCNRLKITEVQYGVYKIFIELGRRFSECSERRKGLFTVNKYEEQVDIVDGNSDGFRSANSSWYTVQQSTYVCFCRANRPVDSTSGMANILSITS